MRRIHKLLHLPLIVALGADAFGASAFTFDSHQEHPISKDPIVADAAVRRLVELRVAPPDVPTLGQVDKETVEFLENFGGSQLPLFGNFQGNKDQKTTIIFEGLTPETGSFFIYHSSLSLFPFSVCGYGEETASYQRSSSLTEMFHRIIHPK